VAKLPAIRSRIGSFLAKGREQDRIGARAFLHLGGLCEPEPAKRSWLRHGGRPATVLVLVWKWKKADAKQQLQGFYARAHFLCARQSSRMNLRAGVGW